MRVLEELTDSMQHILSIRLSADGFSFSVLNPSDDSSFLYMPYAVDPSVSLTANVKRMVADNNEFLHRPFMRTNILVDTAAYTLIPFELFEDEQAEDIFYHCHPRRPNETILYNILDRSNVVVVFAMDKSTCSLIDEHFPGARIFAAVSPLIEHCSLKSRMGNNRKMYLYLQRRTVDVMAYEYGIPQFVNTFSNRGGSDILYYALNVWKLLDFSQSHDELYLIGGAFADDALVEGLRKFVKTVSVVHPSAEFNRSLLAKEEEVPYDMQTLLLGNL